MGWSETHRYYQALREVEADLDRRQDGVVVWRRHFAAVFGSPQGLQLALRRRWLLLVEAQVEVAFERSGQPADELRAIAREHQGLLRAVVRDEPRWRTLLAEETVPTRSGA